MSDFFCLLKRTDVQENQISREALYLAYSYGDNWPNLAEKLRKANAVLMRGAK